MSDRGFVADVHILDDTLPVPVPVSLDPEPDPVFINTGLGPKGGNLVVQAVRAHLERLLLIFNQLRKCGPRPRPGSKTGKISAALEELLVQRRDELAPLETMAKPVALLYWQTFLLDLARATGTETRNMSRLFRRGTTTSFNDELNARSLVQDIVSGLLSGPKLP